MDGHHGQVAGLQSSPARKCMPDSQVTARIRGRCGRTSTSTYSDQVQGTIRERLKAMRGLDRIKCGFDLLP